MFSSSFRSRCINLFEHSVHTEILGRIKLLSLKIISEYNYNSLIGKSLEENPGVKYS